MITQAELDLLHQQMNRMDWVIETQKELLDIQRELIRTLIHSGVRLKPSELVDPIEDPPKWKYNPGPTCECMKGEN